jgi:hypothetical protein
MKWYEAHSKVNYIKSKLTINNAGLQQFLRFIFFTKQFMVYKVYKCGIHFVLDFIQCYVESTYKIYYYGSRYVETV